MIRNPIRAVPGGDVTALRPAQGAVCSGSAEGRWTSPAGWAYEPPFPKPLREQGVRPHSWPLSTTGPTPAGVTCVLAGRVTRPDREGPSTGGLSNLGCAVRLWRRGRSGDGQSRMRRCRMAITKARLGLSRGLAEGRRGLLAVLAGSGRRRPRVTGRRPGTPDRSATLGPGRRGRRRPLPVAGAAALRLRARPGPQVQPGRGCVLLTAPGLGLARRHRLAAGGVGDLVRGAQPRRHVWILGHKGLPTVRSRDLAPPSCHAGDGPARRAAPSGSRRAVTLGARAPPAPVSSRGDMLSITSAAVG